MAGELVGLPVVPGDGQTGLRPAPRKAREPARQAPLLDHLQELPERIDRAAKAVAQGLMFNSYWRVRHQSR
jgi:hypothetical protein